MKTNSSTFLIAAVIFFLGTLGVFGVALYEIKNQNKNFGAQQQLISEQTAKELSYSKVQSLLESTVDDRKLINNLFLAEKDTINFISDIEKDAALLGVSLETKSLSIKPKEVKEAVVLQPAKLAVSFEFSGSEKAVRDFFILLESIPLYKSFVSMHMFQESGSQWKINTSIELTLAYD